MQARAAHELAGEEDAVGEVQPEVEAAAVRADAVELLVERLGLFDGEGHEPEQVVPVLRRQVPEGEGVLRLVAPELQGTDHDPIRDAAAHRPDLAHGVPPNPCARHRSPWGRLTAPSMWPATGSIGSMSPR